MNWLERMTKFFYCWVSNYYLKKYYSAFYKNLNHNQIYSKDNKKVCVGFYTSDAKPFNKQWEKLG